MSRETWCRSFLTIGTVVAILTLGLTVVRAQVTPPDITVCIDPNTGEWLDACDAPQSICDPGGFRVTLTNFVPTNDPTNFSGNAIYTYQVCSPPAGVCTGTARPGEACLENDFCKVKGGAIDDDAVCTRDCAVDDFHDLSHFDIIWPGFGDCLTFENFVGGTCACVPAGGGCSVNPAMVNGDGVCFRPGIPAAKCDNVQNLGPGQCIEMVLSIAGETNKPGLGATIVVDKASQSCNASCMQGPSCQPCLEPPGGGECFTRTLGFWGTHPWITNNYTPVSVCKNELTCDGGGNDLESDPSCGAGTCNDVMEGLGSIGGEWNKNAAYISMVKQLTAAKLNLNATAALVDGAFCSDWEYQGLSIQKWIDYCETLCDRSQQQISSSGCIEALDAFNNSEDTGFQMTPAPFDRPPLDDFGNISGADPSGFQAAQRGGVVIGKNTPGGTNCARP